MTDFKNILLIIGLFVCHQSYTQSSIRIKLVREKFATISNTLHQDNRVGYRFFENTPMVYGEVPLSEEEANIDAESSKARIDELKNSEGIFGLRRAFQIAGAQTVIMSLWKVPDKETKELMIDFYSRLKTGESKSEALRNASLLMMNNHKEN